MYSPRRRMAEEGDKIEEPSLVAAGGEVDQTTTTTESLPRRAKLEWGKAACSEEAIQKCVAAGAFHRGELIEWRAPDKDQTPRLSTSEHQFVILSLTHIICGLRVDASDFLVSVLNHYRLEWSHLTPNSITVLSIFTHLCEAYMQVPPTVEVFAYFYCLYRNMKGETTTLGAVYFRLRDRLKKSYPLYYLKASQFLWVSLWFYAKVPQSCRLTFRYGALEEQNNWKDLLPLSPEQEKQVNQIKELSKKGLTGTDIVHNYLKRRISPLRRRIHLACHCSGPSDPTRDSDKDLSVEDIETKLSYLLDLKKMAEKQPTPRPNNVPTSLIGALANDRANQPLGLLNVPSIHEAKKKALEEITASIKTRKYSTMTYKHQLHASVRRYTRQSARPRKVVVPLPLETDPSPTQGLDPEILDATTNITTAASPKQGAEQKSIEHPAMVEEGKTAELVKPTLSVIGTKRKASAPRSRSQRRAKYSFISVVSKTRMSSLDTGLTKGASSTKGAVLALKSRPLGPAQCSPAYLAEEAKEAGNDALFMLANVVDHTKVVEHSMSNVLLNQQVIDSSHREIDPAQSIPEIVRDQETIEVSDAIEASAAIPVHNREEINSEVIWEQMQKVQSELVSFSVAASSELLEQSKKLVMEIKRLKDRQIMLEQQVKDREDGSRLLTEEMKKAKQDRFKMIEENTKLKDENKDLDDGRRLLTERMKKAEQEAFKIVEENIKLKEENRVQKQTIEEISKNHESTLGALVQKCAEVNHHKEEVAQLIEQKEELQARLSRVNDLLKLVSSTLEIGAPADLCHDKGSASTLCQEKGGASALCQDKGSASTLCQDKGSASTLCQDKGSAP